IPQVQQWNRLKNLTVKIDTFDPAEFAQRLAARQWQLFVTTVSGADVETFYNLMYSTSRGNVVRYNNPTVDAALTPLRGEPYPKAQNELWTTITKNYLADAPALFWYRSALPFALRKGISGVEKYSADVPDFATMRIGNS